MFINPVYINLVLDFGMYVGIQIYILIYMNMNTNLLFLLYEGWSTEEEFPSACVDSMLLS